MLLMPCKLIYFNYIITKKITIKLIHTCINNINEKNLIGYNIALI